MKDTQVALFGSVSGGFFGLGSAQDTRFRFQPITISQNLLSASINAQNNLATLASSRTALRNNGVEFERDAILPPGFNGAERPEESLLRQLSRVRALESFIDTDFPAFRDSEGNVDRQASFVIFRALDNLRVLAEYAADPTTPEATLGRLNEQFQAGFAELQNYIGNTQLNLLEIFTGDQRSFATTSVRLGRNDPDLRGGLIADSPDEIIAGLTGTEQFTVRIERTQGAEDILIDLADVQGDLNLRNITALINERIEVFPRFDNQGQVVLDEDGNPESFFSTRFSFARDAETDRYGLTINGSIIEDVTITAAQAEPAVFVTSDVFDVTAEGAVTTGRITRLDDITGALTNTTFAEFSGIDLEATELAELTADFEDADSVDPNVAALRDQFRADAEEAAGIEEEEDEDTDPTRSVTDIDAENRVAADTQTGGVVTDSQGNVYVVGTSTGSFGSQVNTAETSDVFLNKFDSSGNLIFSRLLGASGEASGVEIAVDANDNIIISGQSDSRISLNDVVDGTDAFVAKFSSAGEEIFRFQLDRFSTSAGTTLTTDANGDILLGGFTAGAISSTSGFSGGRDALLLRLDGDTGQITDSRVFGTSGNEEIGAIEIAADGNILLATEESGVAVLRKVNASDFTNEIFSVNLGVIGTAGSISGIAVEGNRIALTGVTTSQIPTAGGQATVNGSLSGQQDGFVIGLTDSGPSVTADFTTVFGTSGNDTLQDVTINGGNIFVAGTTQGDLEGTRSGAADTFVARLDSNGVVQTINQFGRASSNVAATGISFTNSGTSVLSVLGLPSGNVTEEQPLDIVTQTSAQVGDYFEIQIGRSRPIRIEVQEGDTYRNLERRIRIATSRFLEVSSLSGEDGQNLRIQAINRRDIPDIQLLAGNGDRDLLSKIGLEAGRLLPSDRALNINTTGEDDEDELGGSFSLGFSGPVSIASGGGARYTLGLINNAISTIQRAFRSLEPNPLQDLLDRPSANGPVSPRTLNRIAGFETALARLSAGTNAAALSILT